MYKDKKIPTWKIAFEFQKVISSLWSIEGDVIFSYIAKRLKYVLDHRQKLNPFMSACELIWNDQVALLLSLNRN